MKRCSSYLPMPSICSVCVGGSLLKEANVADIRLRSIRLGLLSKRYDLIALKLNK